MTTPPRKTLTLPARPTAAPASRAVGQPPSGAARTPPSQATASTPAHAPRPAGRATQSNARTATRSTPIGAQRPQNPARRAVAAAAPHADNAERLSKRVMQLTGCSRSEAEQYIGNGYVRVDGVVVEDPPHRVSDASVVTLSPDATLLALQAVSFVLNKPPQWLDGVDEDEDAPSRSRPGQRTVLAPGNARTLLTAPKQWPQDVTQQKFLKRYTLHLEACVPLESGASGLVVFTQDWRVTRKLEEHMMEMEHEYMVDIAQAVAPEHMQALTRLLKDVRENLPAVKASIGSSTPASARLRFAIKGAHPGLIAYVLGKVGLPIAALQRTRIGRVALGPLPVGQWRYLAGFEKF